MTIDGILYHMENRQSLLGILEEKADEILPVSLKNNVITDEQWDDIILKT